ncbi:alpha-hydroxy acid oxidase [Rhodococcus sp. LB1]|uniref:alpha-hydroxy acid oxidase n=1 Tax=Rhodococcus sp. LB1 TaxID=1807499 RepID=UPI00077AD8AF|nr:alpha-hydroxy acid oxidase [Rhodococcus sp. LB1]KXX58050.1 alpha-hydroxy-acid oxidizing enzyme [Rhodococcus sp. LB1]
MGPRPWFRRRFPRSSELAPLLRPRPFILDRTDRRLARAESVSALRAIARQRVPRAVFDYTDGGAGDEIAMERSAEFFRDIEFHPRVLRDVSRVDTRTPVLGSESALPFGLGPTGFTRMMHHEGEIGVARAAARAGVPYALSTMGTTSLEDVSDAVPASRKWFQLYLWRDREASRDLVRRAAEAGYEALVLTVDTPVAGPRLRDVRNGLTIPPSLTLRTVVDASRKPSWWFNLLSTPPLEFASMSSKDETIAQLVGSMFDPAATVADLGWLREIWGGKLIVKGVQGVADARAVVDAGADAVVVSNHGGRQLDRAPVPMEQLPAIAKAIGDHADVLVDGGIRSGADVAVALCLGADFVLIGRAYLFGLMAGGERGVDRALELMAVELRNTMQLLGVDSIDQLQDSHVRRRDQRG